MPEDDRSIEEIEAELARERAALNANLALLQDRLSLPGMAKEALAFLKPSASQPARNFLDGFDRSVRSNPVAALVAGAGLVWLASAPQRRGPANGRTVRMAGATVTAANAIATVVAAMEPEEIRAVADEVDRICRAGAARLRTLDAEMRRAARDLKDGARDAARQTRDYAAEKAQVAAGVAAEVKARLEGGLDGLSDEAAAAVVAARQVAYEARRRASRKAGDAYDEIAAMVDRSPMAVGATALAAGALAAFALRAFAGRR